METKAIEERLEELKQLFGQYDYEIGMVETEFQTRVEELRKELLAKRDKLVEQREQVRGAYTELYILIHPEEKEKLVKPEPQQEQESVQLNNITTEDVKEPQEEQQEKQEQEEQVTEPHNPESILTEEQVKQIQQVIEKQKDRVYESEPVVDDKKDDKKEKMVPSNTTKITPQPKQEDIPDYLKDEYNK